MIRVLGLAILTAGCIDRPIAAVNEACREQMAEIVYHHACQHGRIGPYEPVVAVATRAASPPVINAAQRVLAIELPRPDPDERSYMRLVPSRDGHHAVFAGADYQGIAVALFDADRPVAPTPIEPPDPTRCGGMVEVVGFELAIGRDYLVELGPSTAPAVQMFVEHLGTFNEDWSDRCVD